MLHKSKAFIIANFGGPRNIPEITPFLVSLLTDPDVIRTPLPRPLHYAFFKRQAIQRAKDVKHQYEAIGGRSPIFEDTEAVAAQLNDRLDGPALAFHRYLPATHGSFLARLAKIPCDEIRVFPMYPQFSYATTGSVARWFNENLPRETENKLRWIKSYPAHPAYILTMQNAIRSFMRRHSLEVRKTLLLFSAHGIPKTFVATGDIYKDECELSVSRIMAAFPEALGVLSYQSKFGKGEWLKPYTLDVSEQIDAYRQNRESIIFVPVSFTSDHLETLFEVEHEYMSVIREKGIHVYRLPALNRNPDWIAAIATILQEENCTNNRMLVR